MHNLRADGTGFGRKGTARHRAGTNRTAERFGHRSSSPAGAARRSRCRGRAYRRPKSLPGRAPAVKRPSAPGYHPHRLRHGTESPTVEASPAPLLPTRCFLLGERNTSERPAFLNEACSSKRRSTSPPLFPENLRPSTRHRGPMLPSILTSTKQRVSKTAKRGVSKTRRQHNRKTAQQRVCKTAQQENKRAMNSRRQDFSASVRTEVSTSVSTDCSQSVRTEVRQSDAFPRLQHPMGLFILTGFVPDAGFGNGMIRLFRLAGEQAGTGRDIRPVFFGGGQKHYMFCPRRQAVFSVTRNRFRNRKQLARKGMENSSEVVVFYRAPRVPTRISILQNVFTLSARNSLQRSSETDLNGHKSGDDFAKSSPSNGVIPSTF